MAAMAAAPRGVAAKAEPLSGAVANSVWTPAMEAGVLDHVWNGEEIAGLTGVTTGTKMTAGYAGSS
jgi:hypothetical protein